MSLGLYDVSTSPNPYLDYLALRHSVNSHPMPSEASIPDTAASDSTRQSDGSAQKSVDVAPSTENSEPGSRKMVSDKGPPKLRTISPSLVTRYTRTVSPSVQGKGERYDDAFEGGGNLKLKVQAHDTKEKEGEDTIDFPEA
jgi:hypothetical protein